MSPDFHKLPGLFERVAKLKRVAGEPEFKAGAYEKAARALTDQVDHLSERIEQGTLTELPGIGKGTAAQITSYAEEGELPALRDLEAALPGDLIRWLDIPGLGPKRIHLIHRTLKIETLDALLEAAQDGRLAGIKGLGAKTAEKLTSAIEWIQQHAERCRFDEAESTATTFLQLLQNTRGVQKVELAGSYRRGCETIGDLDLLAACTEPEAADIHHAFCTHPDVVEVLVSGDTKSSVRSRTGRQIDLRTVRASHFAAALVYFTGSKEHNITLRRQAKSIGMSLNEYGLTDLDSGHETSPESEEALYAKLELPFTAPELREAEYDSDLLDNALPSSLLSNQQLRGVLHAHSTWSDGAHSLEDMARACIERGYEYLGITDHSQTAAYAGGLRPDAVKRQWEEIDVLNAQFAEEGHVFEILKGIESDILPDGSLDYEDSLLEGFEFVIASLHAQLDQKAADIQARVERALAHPATTFLGHPTGRLLLKRKGADLDVPQLIQVAAEHNTGIEINANARRLELDWRYGSTARALNLWTCISPDAHAIEQLDYMRYGTTIARKAGFASDRVVNTFNLSELKTWLRNR